MPWLDIDQSLETTRRKISIMIELRRVSKFLTIVAISEVQEIEIDVVVLWDVHHSAVCKHVVVPLVTSFILLY